MNKIIQNLNEMDESVQNALKLPPYHYVELCLDFQNYRKDELTIPADLFITMNSLLFQNDDDDQENEEKEEISDEVFQKVFKVISNGSEQAPLFAVYAYFQKIGIKEELNDESLFKILSKDKSTNIDFSDVNNLIQSLEDFIGEKQDWTDFIDSFNNKKLAKRNLAQNNFGTNLINLFDKAAEKFREIAFKSYEFYINNTKNEAEKKSQGTISEKDIKKNSNISGDDKSGMSRSEHYQTIAAYRNDQNNNNNNFMSADIFDNVFDKRKEEKIFQIKSTSLLYDIPLEEFLDEFKKYENCDFDKNNFINALSQIIQEKTSDVFRGPMLRYSLSILYQYINVEHKNKISYYEILGPIIILTKASNEDRIKTLFSFNKDELILVISGLLSLYLNEDVVKDFSILSEIFIKACNEMNLVNANEFYNWIFNTDENEQQNNMNIDLFVEEDNEQETSFSNTQINEVLKYKFNQTKFSENSRFSIIEITNKLLDNSLLGQINVSKLNSFVEDLLKEKYEDKSEKEKAKITQEFMKFISKYINLNNSEFIEVPLLHSLFMLLFKGSTTEKVKSIFMIYDTDENSLLKSKDLCNYLSNVFHFLLNEMEIKDRKLSDYLGNNIVESISEGKDGVNFIQILEFFDNIDIE